MRLSLVSGLAFSTPRATIAPPPLCWPGPQRALLLSGSAPGSRASCLTWRTVLRPHRSHRAWNRNESRQEGAACAPAPLAGRQGPRLSTGCVRMPSGAGAETPAPQGRDCLAAQPCSRTRSENEASQYVIPPPYRPVHIAQRELCERKSFELTIQANSQLEGYPGISRDKKFEFCTKFG